MRQTRGLGQIGLDCDFRIAVLIYGNPEPIHPLMNGQINSHYRIVCKFGRSTGVVFASTRDGKPYLVGVVVDRCGTSA